MKKIRILALALVCVIAIMSFSACKTEDKTEVKLTKTEESTTTTTTTTAAKTEEKTLDTTPMKVFTLKGPTGMGMAKMITDSNADEKTPYTFTIANAPDEITASVINGEADIAALPVNLASVLYNKTNGEVKVACVNTLGVLYILENGTTINSLADLKGKKIYATGQASTPEYTLRYLLTKNGIDPDKDVTIEYFADHAELATKMASGECDIGMLPEPNVSTVLAQNTNSRIAIDLTDEWNKLGEGELAQGCVVVNAKFASEHPEAVAQFLEKYKASVEYVNANVEEASKMIETIGIVPKAAIAAKALPNCNICYIDGDEMKSCLGSFYKVLFDADAKSVGGKLPNDDFYYSK